MFIVPGATLNVFSQESNEENCISNSESSFEGIYPQITKRKKIRRSKEKKSKSPCDLKTLPVQKINKASYNQNLLETSFEDISKKRKKIKLFNLSSNDETSQIEVSNITNSQKNEDSNITDEYSIWGSPETNLEGVYTQVMNQIDSKTSLTDPLSLSKDNEINSQENAEFEPREIINENPKNSGTYLQSSCEEIFTIDEKISPKASSTFKFNKNNNQKTSVSDKMQLSSPICTQVTKQKLNPSEENLQLELSLNKEDESVIVQENLMQTSTVNEQTYFDSYSKNCDENFTQKEKTMDNIVTEKNEFNRKRKRSRRLKKSHIHNSESNEDKSLMSNIFEESPTSLTDPLSLSKDNEINSQENAEFEPREIRNENAKNSGTHLQSCFEEIFTEDEKINSPKDSSTFKFNKSNSSQKTSVSDKMQLSSPICTQATKQKLNPSEENLQLEVSLNKEYESVIVQENLMQTSTVNEQTYFDSYSKNCDENFTQKEKTMDNILTEKNEFKRKRKRSHRFEKSYTDNSESNEDSLMSNIFEESPSEYEPSDIHESSDESTKKRKFSLSSKRKNTSNTFKKCSKSKNNKLNSQSTQQLSNTLDSTVLTYNNFGNGQATSTPALEENKIKKSKATKFLGRIANKNKDLSSTWNSACEADNVSEGSKQNIETPSYKTLLQIRDSEVDDKEIDEFLNEWLNRTKITTQLPIEVKRELFSFLKIDTDLLKKLKNLDINIDWELPELHKLGEGFSSIRALKLDRITDVVNGEFSEKENNKIISNWKEFCEIYGFDKYDFRPFIRVFHSCLSPLDHIQKKKFALFLAKGLNKRKPYNVYVRFVIITKCYKRGRFSRAEDDILLYCKKHVPSKYVSALCSILLHRHRCVILKRLKKLLKANVSESLDINQKSENDEDVDWEIIGHEIFKIGKVSRENNIIDHDVFKQVALKTNTSVIKVAKAFHLKIQPSFNCSKIIYKDYFRIRLIKMILKYRYDQWNKIDWDKLNKEMYNLGQVFIYSEFRKILKQHVPPSFHPRLKLCLDKLELKLPELEEMATMDQCLKMHDFSAIQECTENEE